MPRFHTCNIHENARKVNANLQFVTLFVRNAHFIQLNAIRFVQLFIFATDFSRFFSSLLHFGYNLEPFPYKMAFQFLCSQADFCILTVSF